MAPKRDQKKRLGKKHRQASTRPKLGKAPRTGAQVTNAAPKKRKAISTKQAAAAAAKRTSKRSPEFERKRTVDPNAAADTQAHPRSSDSGLAERRRRPRGPVSAEGGAGSRHEERAWAEAEKLAGQISLDGSSSGGSKRKRRREGTAISDERSGITDVTAYEGLENTSNALPLVAICGRPNVGKSTLFNRLTGTRRSIVGDEPGITRDRIYGEVEWQGREARLVDTGGVVPDDEALIPAEIFRQARVALDEADVIVMVVDGRTELAAPDMELARLLIRSGAGKPLFLAVNKMDAPELEAAAENYRQLGFKELLPVSAEHNVGIGDLLDAVWAVLPAPGATEEDDRAEFVHEESPESMEGFEDEELEDMDGGGDPELDDEPDAPAFDTPVKAGHHRGDSPRVQLSAPGDTTHEGTVDAREEEDAAPKRRLRSHGETVLEETRIAIIGRPNVGKSTLLNALTGSERAIVSPIAGTTRDAVDEVVEHDGKSFRFVDTAGIRRKGKTKLMAEKLSVIMSRKHLEAADVALLVLDATEGVTGSDATIGGYAHESGRSVIIVVNKWDLMSEESEHGGRKFDGKPLADQKVYEQQVRDHLKYLDYAPVVFLSAAEGEGIEGLFKKIELVARERRKRVSTGAMNRFLDNVDFERASVPMRKRVRIYYMTQAAVAPPTFVLFVDRDVKLHFSYERFLANEIRRAFRFIGSPIWFKVKPRNKKKAEE